MTDKTQDTGAGAPAARLDAILLAMHLRQRAKLTATGNADALSQNAANVLVAQYDRIAELEAAAKWLQQSAQAVRDPAAEKPEAGRYVLAWMDGRATPIRAMWVPSKWLQADDECPEDWAEYDEAKDEYFCPEGWYEKNEHEEKNWSVSTPVVAWMELPRLDAAPQAAPPAPAAVAVPAERQAFERYQCDRMRRDLQELTIHADDRYDCDDIQAEWEVWQARAALAAAPAQAVAVPMAALPERPKPQFPAPSAGVESDCYTGMQMLSFGFACAMAQRELAAAPGQPFAPSFADGLLHSSVLHKLWEESEPTAQHGQPGALAWQLSVFAGKVAQAATAPAQAVAVPAPTEAVIDEPVTKQMIDAGAKTAREYMARTGGNNLTVIYRAMRAVAPAGGVSAPPAQEHATQLAGQGQTFAQWWDEQRKTAAERAPGDDWMDLNADDRDQYEAAFSAGKKSAAPAQAQEDAAAMEAPAAPEWERVRRGLSMMMMGFASTPGKPLQAAEAALDAATEPGMPLACLRALAAAPQAPAAPAVDARAERDAAFEAVRNRLCGLQRYSFVLDDDGVVRRAQDRSGNWIEFDEAHELFDPVAVDAAIVAQAKGGE